MFAAFGSSSVSVVLFLLPSTRPVFFRKIFMTFKKYSKHGIKDRLIVLAVYNIICTLARMATMTGFDLIPKSY